MIGEWLFAPEMARLKLRLQMIEATKRGFDKAIAYKREHGLKPVGGSAFIGDGGTTFIGAGTLV